MRWDHLILGAMFVVVAYLSFSAARLAWFAEQAARESAEKARAHEQLIGATLEVARAILREVQK